jgi:hypothetical protein
MEAIVRQVRRRVRGVGCCLPPLASLTNRRVVAPQTIDQVKSSQPSNPRLLLDLPKP